ncbi:hypothetical protein L3X38_040653 [Prunus dulcis]|uniref:Uncharacterized protein n=1 Tax=Prunus dulcis TaxID=3755 RepID=A0AAD4V9G5_PRUDU|nr:hypothetical protein L3X38_040653 [Prunus dulcis]
MNIMKWEKADWDPKGSWAARVCFEWREFVFRFRRAVPLAHPVTQGWPSKTLKPSAQTLPFGKVGWKGFCELNEASAARRGSARFWFFGSSIRRLWIDKGKEGRFSKGISNHTRFREAATASLNPC